MYGFLRVRLTSRSSRDPVGSFIRGAKRDVFMKGDCDDNIRKLCKMAGWDEELEEIYSETRAK